MNPNDRKLESRIDDRRDREQREAEDAPRSGIHTYPDGSQRVGQPPWPEKSPKEEAQEMARTGAIGVPLQQPAPGQPTSGASASEIESTVHEGNAELRAEQQLTADVLSGKDPHTPNPTTSSDKPALAGQDNVIRGDNLETSLSAEPTADELREIVDKIEPAGDVEATDEQKEAAAVQILRETKGNPAADTEASTKATKPAAKPAAKTSAKKK